MVDCKQQEKRKHGDFLLPLGVYDVEIGSFENFIPAHWHKELEVILVTSGSFKLQINSNFYTCSKGDLILINTEELHYFTAIPEHVATWHCIVFDIAQLGSSTLDSCSVNFISPILNKSFNFITSINEHSEGYPKLKKIFLDIIDSYHKREYAFELEIKALMFSFFTCLFQSSLVYEKTPTHIQDDLRLKKIKEVIKYIELHYQDDLQIDTLAKLCHYNMYHFMRCFKKYTGKTCTQFIKNYRLEKSTILLRSTDLSITEVALEVGFSNVSYFIRSFKDKYHVTPKLFKQASENDLSNI